MRRSHALRRPHRDHDGRRRRAAPVSRGKIRRIGERGVTVQSAAIVADPPVALPAFVHRTVAQRVVFGAGTRRRIADEARLGRIDRAMVISTPEQADSANELADLLGGCCALRFTRARMHTPVTVTEEAVALAAQHGIDGLVSVGGGSAIGLSKAIGLRTDLLQVVVPTTYSGSEMTDIVGQT